MESNGAASRETQTDVISGIARELGVGWSGGLAERGFSLVGPGLNLHAAFDGYQHRGRLVISLSVSREFAQHYPYNWECPQITVDYTRPVQTIAREIRHRLIPSATISLADLQSRFDAAQEYERRQAAQVEALISALGGPLTAHRYQTSDSRIYATFPTPTFSVHVDAQVYPTSVDLKLDSLPPHIARAICNTLREAMAQEKAA